MPLILVAVFTAAHLSFTGDAAVLGQHANTPGVTVEELPPSSTRASLRLGRHSSNESGESNHLTQTPVVIKRDMNLSINAESPMKPFSPVPIVDAKEERLGTKRGAKPAKLFFHRGSLEAQVEDAKRRCLFWGVHEHRDSDNTTGTTAHKQQNGGRLPKQSHHDMDTDSKNSDWGQLAKKKTPGARFMMPGR